MQELTSILNGARKLEYQGQESITRLICLNRLAHLAVLGSISDLSGQKGLAFAEQQIKHTDRFTLNRHSLNCLDILPAEKRGLCFEKVKQRLVEDISFFLEREKVFPARQGIAAGIGAAGGDMNKN